MLQDFAILHRRKPRPFVAGDVPAWATCLRTLAFVAPAYQIEPGDELYVGPRAYEFLLEIVCGLHSPIVGETEVMGQFKIFAESWAELQPHRRPLVQRVLSDAKSLRTRHLAHLGTQSYGSWLRRNLDAGKIHVIGAGHLAQEILPYLQKRGEVIWHTRRPVDAPVEVLRFKDRRFDQGAVVVAAPVAAADVSNWLGDRSAAQIFDLRDDAHLDRIPGAVALDQIFRDIQATRARLISRLDRVRTEIAHCAERLVAFEKVRPQGWDDLCA